MVSGLSSNHASSFLLPALIISHTHLFPSLSIPQLLHAGFPSIPFLFLHHPLTVISIIIIAIQVSPSIFSDAKLLFFHFLFLYLLFILFRRSYYNNYTSGPSLILFLLPLSPILHPLNGGFPFIHFLFHYYLSYCSFSHLHASFPSIHLLSPILIISHSSFSYHYLFHINSRQASLSSTFSSPS